jgi:hypothetical protein
MRSTLRTHTFATRSSLSNMRSTLRTHTFATRSSLSNIKPGTARFRVFCGSYFTPAFSTPAGFTHTFFVPFFHTNAPSLTNRLHA